MQTIAFLVFVAYALRRYGANLLEVLEGAMAQGNAAWERGSEIARIHGPRVRNAVIGVTAITCLLFAVAVGLVLFGVGMNEWRLLKDSGASQEVLDRFGLGVIGTLGQGTKTMGWLLFAAFLALQIIQLVRRVAMIGQPGGLVRGARESGFDWAMRVIRYCAPPAVTVVAVLVIYRLGRDFADFMKQVAKEQASYLLASVAVAGGALVLGPWLITLSRGLAVVAWALGTAYDAAGGVLWKVGDVLMDFLAAGGLAEKLGPRASKRERFMAFAESMSWPPVMFWFLATTVLMVWPRKNVVLGMFPAAVFGILLYVFIKWLGRKEWFILAAYFVTLFVFIPWWGINLTMPAVAELPGAWIEEGNTASHCLLPEEDDACQAWKMRRVAAEMRKGASGGLLLPTLPAAPGGTSVPGTASDPSVDAPPDD